MSSSEGRYIPSLDSVKKAAAKLPPAESILVDDYVVKTDKDHSIPFKRIKYKTRTGKGHRWVYEGKVLVK